MFVWKLDGSLSAKRLFIEREHELLSHEVHNRESHRNELIAIETMEATTPHFHGD